MVDILSLEDAARQRAIDSVTALLNVPDSLDKLETLRMKEKRKSEALDSQLKSAMQSQLEDIKSGLEQLHACIALGNDVKENFAKVRSLYSGSLSSKQHELDRMMPLSERRIRVAQTLEHMRHVVKVNENLQKIEALIADDKLLHAHKLLSELEVSRDEVLASLAREPTANAGDVEMIHRYFAPVREQAKAFEKRIKNYMKRLIDTCKAQPVLVVSCLRIVEREELLDSEYEKEGMRVAEGRPKKWREHLVFGALSDTVNEKIVGLQTETRETKDIWLSLYLENILQQFTNDIHDVQNHVAPCCPPHYDIVERFVRMFHTAIAERLLEIYSEGLQDKEALGLLHWIHQRYHGPEGLTSRRLRLPSRLIDSLAPLLPDDVMEQCRAAFLTSTKSKVRSWVRVCLEKNVEPWRTEQKPDSDFRGNMNTNIPIDAFQMFRETAKEARSTVGPDLTYEIVEVCVENLKCLLQDLSIEVEKYRQGYIKFPSEAPHFALYLIAVANSCEMFSKFLDDFLRDYDDIIRNWRLKESANQDHLDGSGAIGDNESKMRSHLDEIRQNIERLPTRINAILCECIFRDLAGIFRYWLTRDKWFNVSHRIGTVIGTVEDYWQTALCHMKPGYLRCLINEIQDRIVVQYLVGLNSSRIKLKSEEEVMQFADKLREDIDALMTFFEEISENNADASSVSMDSPFRFLDAVADLLSTGLDSDSLYIASCTFVKNFPDVPDQWLQSLIQFRGASTADARSHVESAKQSLPASFRTGTKIKHLFTLMSQPLPQPVGEQSVTNKLASVVASDSPGEGTLNKFLSTVSGQNR